MVRASTTADVCLRLPASCDCELALLLASSIIIIDHHLQSSVPILFLNSL
jgi:hypothetical protein